SGAAASCATSGTAAARAPARSRTAAERSAFLIRSRGGKVAAVGEGKAAVEHLDSIAASRLPDEPGERRVGPLGAQPRHRLLARRGRRRLRGRESTQHAEDVKPVVGGDDLRKAPLRKLEDDVGKGGRQVLACEDAVLAAGVGRRI